MEEGKQDIKVTFEFEDRDATDRRSVAEVLLAIRLSPKRRELAVCDASELDQLDVGATADTMA